MIAEMLFAGIDVAKDSLELALRIGGAAVPTETFPNSSAGIRKLVGRFGEYRLPCRAVLEPTSRLHAELLLALAAAPGCEVMPFNPWRASKYQQARGRRAKTDKLDAQNLAVLAEQLADDFEPYTPPGADARQLQLLGRQLFTLVCHRRAVNNRISSFPAADSVNRPVLASLKRELRFIETESGRILSRMRKLVQSEPLLYEYYGLLTGVRGIADQSALQLLAELQVLPAGMGPRQWTAWAGLDPRPHFSGRSRPPMQISRMGNRYIKQVLYMAALTTTQFEPQVKLYYTQLHTRKQSKTLALVVVMRKLLHSIWWMMETRQPFDPSRGFAVKEA